MRTTYLHCRQSPLCQLCLSPLPTNSRSFSNHGSLFVDYFVIFCYLLTTKKLTLVPATITLLTPFESKIMTRVCCWVLFISSLGPFFASQTTAQFVINTSFNLDKTFFRFAHSQLSAVSKSKVADSG